MRSANEWGPMNLRKRLVTAVVGCLLAFGVASTAQAQKFELTPFAGWRFGGGFEELATGTDLTLDDGLSYGLILGIPWNATASVPSRADLEPPGFDRQRYRYWRPLVRPRCALPPRQRHGSLRDTEPQAGRAALNRSRRHIDVARHRRCGDGSAFLGQRRHRPALPRPQIGSESGSRPAGGSHSPKRAERSSAQAAAWSLSPAAASARAS